ncbi:MAG TPA: hypothetical protein VFC39_22850 [Acidobacteriaceae bacterium]|nr:hypothetical protein [Acidobacteriaceae bacterium]
MTRDRDVTEELVLTGRFCGAPGRWSYAGSNLHFGIREHGMGSILNGMAVYGGIIP